MPRTTVQTTSRGQQEQHETTIPKGIAEAMNLQGCDLEWEIMSSNAIKVTKIEPENND